MPPRRDFLGRYVPLRGGPEITQDTVEGLCFWADLEAFQRVSEHLYCTCDLAQEKQEKLDGLVEQ